MTLPPTVSRILFDPLRALAFLSRIPVSASAFAGEETGNTARYSWAFPLAGLLIAAPACLLLWILVTPFGGYAPVGVSCALAVIALIVVTGALHEDGLADVADGFWGGHTRERRLEIMKDSSIGTYGALALASSLLIRTLALSSVLGLQDMGAAMIAIALAAVGSRAVMVMHWAFLPSARPGGVAHKAGQPSKQGAFLALTIAVILALIFAAPVFHWALVLVAALTAAITALFSRICMAKIGGHTGDTIGATQQLNEMTILIALAFAT